tara:strand:- start:39330 stop:40067 length:738 start_codon:yes stop_codon:yes gene_type:complete
MDSSIEKLRDDIHYYGSFGQNYLSNSDIGALLTDPEKFRKPKENNHNFVMGRYFHTKMLEFDKSQAPEFSAIDCSSRNTKIYKEAIVDSEFDILMLQPEKSNIDIMVDKMKNNFSFHGDIYEDGNKFEQPGIIEIGGVEWKGKADVVSDSFVYDLKTTNSLERFKYSANEYNYDSQAWLYEKIFGVPMIFLVIDKKTHKLKKFDCGEQFLERGKHKVFRAMEEYNKFFGENPTESLKYYYAEETL